MGRNTEIGSRIREDIHQIVKLRHWIAFKSNLCRRSAARIVCKCLCSSVETPIVEMQLADRRDVDCLSLSIICWSPRAIAIVCRD